MKNVETKRRLSEELSEKEITNEEEVARLTEELSGVKFFCRLTIRRKRYVSPDRSDSYVSSGNKSVNSTRQIQTEPPQRFV